MYHFNLFLEPLDDIYPLILFLLQIFVSLYDYRLFDHPKGLNGHKIDTTGSFSKLIKMIYKCNMLLN